MAIFKRGKTWWTDFSVDGQRYRESLHTTDWREAQAKQKELIAQASLGKLASTSQQFGRLAFAKAADRYLEGRKLELATRSYKKEKQLLVYPRNHFQNAPLHRFTAEDLHAYREKRAQQGAGASYLNMEMGAIRRILKRAKRWHMVGEGLRPLKERRQAGRALSHEEKVRLLKIAESKPEWQNARLAQILALNTTMRAVRLRDCDGVTLT